MKTTTPTRMIAAACGAGVLLLGAAACGSDPAPAASSTGTGDTGTNQSSTGQNGQRPGANGKVAAVTGSTAQVQSQDSGQVAVTWNGSTTFTKQVAAKLADIAVGDCVLVQPVQPDDDSTETTTTKVAAATVRITDKVDGSCSPARGGPGSAGPQLQGAGPGSGSAPGDRPSGAPDGAPEGGRPQVRGMAGAFGEVTSTSASGFVVASTVPTEDDPTKTEKKDVTVTVGSTTTYATTATGAAADVKVGVCVNADGSTDDTGAVTATRIAVTPAVAGECTGGMVRFSRSGDQGSTGQES